MVNKWLGASLVALVMAVPALADKASTNAQPFSTPAMVIHPDEHVTVYKTEFQHLVDTSPHWRTEVQKQGFDLAFTEWLLMEHPWEFAAICTNVAEHIMNDPSKSALVTEFREAVKQNPTLKSEIDTTSEPTAFLDWLRAKHQDEYKHALVDAGVSDASSRWAHETYGWGPS